MCINNDDMLLLTVSQLENIQHETYDTYVWMRMENVLVSNTTHRFMEFIAIFFFRALKMTFSSMQFHSIRIASVSLLCQLFREPYFILIHSYVSLENRQFTRCYMYYSGLAVLIYDDIMLKMGLYSSGSGCCSMVFLCQCQQWIVSMYLLVNSYFLFNLHTIKRYRKRTMNGCHCARFFRSILVQRWGAREWEREREREYRLKLCC